MVPLLALAAILMPHGGGAARVGKKSTRTGGRIASLYTFGAPHLSNRPLTDADGACLPGYRVVQFKKNDVGRDSTDLVPKLLNFLSFKHPKLQTLSTWSNTDRDALKESLPCGSNPSSVTRNDIGLHDLNLYTTTVERLGSSYAGVQAAARIGMINSRDDVNVVKQRLVGSGWNLVGRAAVKEDVTHLFQESASLRCMFTFEGSDSADDWLGNLQIGRTSFCGLSQRVHVGFKAELLSMVRSSGYQSNIKDKLGKCSAVDVVGHSLGGGVATLLTACVNNQIPGPEYDLMSWSLSTPELMDSL